MNIAAWNCRGAGSKSFPRILREVVRKYDIKVMALMETRISDTRADRQVRELGFTNWIRVEATGFAGGIWVLWNKADVQLKYVVSTTQFVHCQIWTTSSTEYQYATFVYGDTTTCRRKSLWRDLESIARRVQGQWIVLGDFNTFLSPADKLGGATVNYQEMDQFQTCLNNCGLSQIPVVGDRYTWEKEGVQERLDWGFCNFGWEIAHPNLKLFHQLR